MQRVAGPRRPATVGAGTAALRRGRGRSSGGGGGGGLTLLVVLGVVLLAQAAPHRLLAALGLGAHAVARMGQIALPPLLVVEEAVALGAVRPLAPLDAARLALATLRAARPALVLVPALLLRFGLSHGAGSIAEPAPGWKPPSDLRIGDAGRAGRVGRGRGGRGALHRLALRVRRGDGLQAHALGQGLAAAEDAQPHPVA